MGPLKGGGMNSSIQQPRHIDEFDELVHEAVAALATKLDEAFPGYDSGGITSSFCWKLERFVETLLISDGLVTNKEPEQKAPLQVWTRGCKGLFIYTFAIEGPDIDAEVIADDPKTARDYLWNWGLPAHRANRDNVASMELVDTRSIAPDEALAYRNKLAPASWQQ